MSHPDPDLEKLIDLLVPGWQPTERDPVAFELTADVTSPPFETLRDKYASDHSPICYQLGPICVPGTGSGPGGIVFIQIAPRQGSESFGTRTVVIAPDTQTILAMEI